MQFFLGNLYSERLSGGRVPATGPVTSSVAAADQDADDRLADRVLVGSR